MVLRRCALATALAAVAVVATAVPSSSDDATVTWDQARVALAAAHGRAPSHPTPTPHPGRPTTPPGEDQPAAPGTMTVAVTIPDLSWAIDDPTASASTRRAACHQVTGLDDETAAPLAACLAHVRGGGTGQGAGHETGHGGHPGQSHGHGAPAGPGHGPSGGQSPRQTFSAG